MALGLLEYRSILFAHRITTFFHIKCKSKSLNNVIEFPWAMLQCIKNFKKDEVRKFKERV